jgi:modulator of FtsH protease
MSTDSYTPYVDTTASRTRSASAIMGQVMFLVAVAIGFMAAGTFIGREIESGTAQIFSFVGFGMLIATWFIGALRHGPLGIGWLCGLALAIGIGIGPLIEYVTTTQPGDVSTAVGITALTVLGMACIGWAMDKDLSGWMKPLTYVVMGCVVISLGALIFGGLGTLSPVLSLIILVASAALILVDFNYIRKHATEDDVVWLATGIFVSIVNIFLSLLNLTSD